MMTPLLRKNRRISRMFLHTSIRRWQPNNSTSSQPNIIIHDPDEIPQMDPSKTLNTNKSQLQFAYRSRGETFGQLVHEADNDRDPLHNSRVVSQEEALLGVDPRYRDEQSGELLDGATSKDARLSSSTLAGRVNHSRVFIPNDISKAVQNNMLYLYEPKALKQYAVEWYQKLNNHELRGRCEREKDADVTIATSFAQDYAVAYQVLDELIKRIGDKKKSKINSVLDVGYGPGVGMLALNEIMGENFNPDFKDVVINGSYHMERRAKILLSRQAVEYFPRIKGEESHEIEENEKKLESEAEAASTFEFDENGQEIKKEDDEYVGKVKTKAINIKTVILDNLRSSDRKYDLIIVQHQMLTSKENFPLQVDQKLENFVKRLSPGGHLVILERGNPLGSEIIARARQVVLRPENNENKLEKIPRSFKSSAKKSVSKLSRLTTEEKEEAMKGIESELLEDFEILEEKDEEDIPKPIDLKIIAPCSHHGKCPLQFFELDVFRFGEIGKKLRFCNFSVDVHRPDYLLELKRGKKLATKWTDKNSGVGIKGLAKAGRGRDGGLDFETASFSYLIIERSTEDPVFLQEKRENEKLIRPIGFESTKLEEYPRILGAPLKKKGFVVMDVCAPSGHLEKWHVSKSVGKQEYHDARKSQMGDLWGLTKKSAIQSTKENTFYFERLEKKRENLRRQKKRDAEKLKRKIKKDFRDALEAEPEDFKGSLSKMAKIDAYNFLSKPKEEEKQKDKRNFKF